MNEVKTYEQLDHPGLSPTIGFSLLVIWFLVLSIFPDPRPLGAPDVIVRLTGDLFNLSENLARAIATFALRAMGIGLLGFFVALCFNRLPIGLSAALSIASAPLLAIASMWINYGYFPIWFQLQFALAFAVVGVLAGLALRKSLWARLAFFVVFGGFFLWAIPSGISDDLDRSARITGIHVLESVDEISRGDEGFAQLMSMAFEYAEENSEVTDPVHANKAAILALGVILGDDRVADVAGRPLRGTYRKEMERLRRKIELRGRGDLPRHFWVSAALTVLSDGNRSTAVGVMKELMDSNPGGSGFSFVDLVADRAGVLFAEAATKDRASALKVQSAIRSGLSAEDFCPPIIGLPEGIPRDEFQSTYGGLGGERTSQIVDDIKHRLYGCRGLWVESMESIEVVPLDVDRRDVEPKSESSDKKSSVGSGRSDLEQRHSSLLRFNL